MSASASPARRIERYADPATLARAAAHKIVERLNAAVAARGRATLALAGGSTPKALYRLFADDDGLRAALPWGKIEFFFGDERHVPPDHADSNYRMFKEALLDRLPKGLLDPARVHRIQSENAAGAAAEQYAEELTRTLGSESPTVDVALLGMGPDGHTASLFPGTTALRDHDRSVCAVWVDKFSTYRITLTPPALCAARCVMFLVAGADKTKTLKAVLQGPPESDRYPSQGILSRAGETLWLVDEVAAAELS
ncbi:MAG: 6-phosphogluconolactonase [Verrucomicrobia bacterium]|nr:6-phosphogluconolactonase [Verrucomicrobiota bacterium]